jgi:hypothetical protein
VHIIVHHLMRLLPQGVQDQIVSWILIILPGLFILALLAYAVERGQSKWARVRFVHGALWLMVPVAMGVFILAKMDKDKDTWGHLVLAVAILGAEAFVCALIWSITRSRRAEETRADRGNALLGAIVLMLRGEGVMAAWNIIEGNALLGAIVLMLLFLGVSAGSGALWWYSFRPVSLPPSERGIGATSSDYIIYELVCMGIAGMVLLLLAGIGLRSGIRLLMERRRRSPDAARLEKTPKPTPETYSLSPTEDNN